MLPPVQGFLLLDATEVGFDLVTTAGEGLAAPDTTGKLSILTSTDGRSWEASETVVGAGALWATAAGRVGGALRRGCGRGGVQ